jgi:hypothetical protein
MQQQQRGVCVWKLASDVLEITVEVQRTQATGSVGEIKDRLDLREGERRGSQDQALLTFMLQTTVILIRLPALQYGLSFSCYPTLTPKVLPTTES